MVKEKNILNSMTFRTLLTSSDRFRNQPVAFIKHTTNTAHLIGAKPSKTDEHLTRISCLYSPHSTRYPGVVYLKSPQSS